MGAVTEEVELHSSPPRTSRVEACWGEWGREEDIEESYFLIKDICPG